MNPRSRPRPSDSARDIVSVTQSKIPISPRSALCQAWSVSSARRITRMVDVAEWKRRQAPVGPRVTHKAFGKDRRLPITNAYRG